MTNTLMRPIKQVKPTKKQLEKQKIDELCDAYFKFKAAHAKYEKAKREIKKLTGMKKTITDNYVVNFCEEDRGSWIVDASNCKVMSISKKK